MESFMANRIPYIISEEIVRFVLEVHIKQGAKDWSVAFTNPTAGPWKKIILNLAGDKLEVGRYEREEQRPDLIIFYAKYGVFIIIEAKDNFSKIYDATQIKKSIEVFLKEKKRLVNSKLLKKYTEKIKLKFVNGFLWFDTDANNAELFAKHYSKHAKIDDPLLIINITKHGDDLTCLGKVYSTKDDPEIIASIKELYLNKLG